jgi:hypothetical protein
MYPAVEFQHRYICTTENRELQSNPLIRLIRLRLQNPLLLLGQSDLRDQ